IPHAFAPRALRALLAVKAAPRQTAARVALRSGLLRQVARKRAVLDAGSTLPEPYEGRFTDWPPSLAYGTCTPRLHDRAAVCDGDVHPPHWGAGSCPRQGTRRCRRHAKKPNPSSLLAGRL